MNYVNASTLVCEEPMASQIFASDEVSSVHSPADITTLIRRPLAVIHLTEMVYFALLYQLINPKCFM